MPSELEVIQYYEDQNRVVELYIKGATKTDIKKQTGFSFHKIDKFLAEFKEYAAQDVAIRERARGIVLELDSHYTSIIRDSYEAIEQLKFNDDPKSVLSGLKGIADIQAKRMELLAKAGLLADNSLGDQIAEAERKQEILVGILKAIAKKHPEIAREISSELSQVTGDVEPK